MLIYPAIDLLGGRCVRLARGDFNAATEYSVSPIDVLKRYAEAGAEWAHIVDLDGARSGEPRQHALLAELARSGGLKVQVAGGVRAREDAASLLDAGAARVVVGSMAVKAPGAVASWLDEFGPDRIALALDVTAVDGAPYVAVKGWTEVAELTLWEALNAYPEGAVRHVLATNVAHDGVMTGPDLPLYGEFLKRFPKIALQASGGVRNIADITALKRAGAAGAIIGRALYEGALDLAEAVRAGA